MIKYPRVNLFMQFIFIVLLIIVSLLFSLSFAVLSIGFNKRCEGNENLRYLTAEDFSSLNAQPVSFNSDKKQILNGFLYSSENTEKFKALIVFSHGMGAGHLSYTTEINYFAQKGYLVLAYDNTGTCLSQGKKLYGFAQGVTDLKYALDFVGKSDELKNLPVLLLGHSWGGYSVCNVSALNPTVKICGIAAFSPFNSVNTLINDFSKAKIKYGLRFLSPFLDIANLIKFGKAGLLKSCRSIASNSIPTLVMHGGNDMTVNVNNSPVGLKTQLIKNTNARTVLYENKFHNVYLSREAEQYLNEVFGKISSLKKDSPNVFELYNNIDYSLITKEDPSVMATVESFFEDCIN